MSDSVLVLMIKEYYKCETEMAEIMLANAKRYDSVDNLIEVISEGKGETKHEVY